MQVKSEQGLSDFLELSLSDSLFGNMEPIDMEFGYGDHDLAQFKLDEETLIDSGISSPIEAMSPGPVPLFDTSAFDSFGWELLKASADAQGTADDCLTDKCAQLDLEAAGQFIGLQLDFNHVLGDMDTTSVAMQTETSSELVGAINPKALQSAAEEEDEEIDVVGLEHDDAREHRQIMELQHRRQSITIAQPVIFTTDSTTQLPIPTVIPGMASIVLPTYTSFPPSTETSPSSSRSTSPTNIKSARMQPYPTPPHTPKRNTERKRQLHNELERKRREDLNTVFNQLGEVIPSLTVGSKGAPTQTQILQGATHLLRSLKSDQSHLAAQREAVLLEQSRLQAKLNQLKLGA